MVCKRAVDAHNTIVNLMDLRLIHSFLLFIQLNHLYVREPELLLDDQRTDCHSRRFRWSAEGCVFKSKLVGQDGNIFAIMGEDSKRLKTAGFHGQAKEMSSRVFDAGSYNEALSITSEYDRFTDSAVFYIIPAKR